MSKEDRIIHHDKFAVEEFNSAANEHLFQFCYSSFFLPLKNLRCLLNRCFQFATARHLSNRCFNLLQLLVFLLVHHNGRMAGQLEGWKAGGLEGWKAGRLEGWRAGQLDGWMAGSLEGWKAGWLDS
jgi:hypothetical protein